MKKLNILLKVIIYLFLIIGALLIFLPMYLTVVTSFKTEAESAKNFFSLPSSFYLGNFVTVINKAHFSTFVFNSVVITVISVAVIMISVPMVSFAISRNFGKKYYRYLYYYIIIGLFVPFQVVMLPIVKIMYSVDLMNQFGLILLYITLATTQGVFLCVAYLKSIPFELEEAAYIDGCTVFMTFRKVVYPLMSPIVITVSILNGLWIWNDYLLPLIILNKSEDYWTLPLFQFNFKSQYSFDYNLAFASFFLSMLPIIILYAVAQKNIMGGLTEGAIKS